MSDSYPAELAGRWRPGVVLKRDVFSTIERGHFPTAPRGNFLTPGDEVDAVLRRIDQVPWWSFPVARALFARERRALDIVGPLGVGPSLLFAGRRVLVRGFIHGIALHLAKPHGDVGYFRSAKLALRKLHRAGICHNDLAKEQNWLVGADGQAYLTDFQLAIRFRRPGRLSRLARYEDLRHLLKHKRRYVPEALTAKERRVLARKSLPTRIWMATGKKVYYAVTRGLFRFTDREGGGLRLIHDAPLIAARLREHPQVRDAAVVAFPDRRSGTGLYAFVEAEGGVGERALRDLLGRTPAPPEHIQLIDALPRDASGAVRNEILQLVAMNQLDLITPLLHSDAERALIDRIVAQRLNVRDRYAF